MVKNLPFNITNDDLFYFFGKYGNINQIWVLEKENKGNCFVVYSNYSSALKAQSSLNGVNFKDRYLITTLYHFDKSQIQNEDLFKNSTLR